MDPEPVSFHIEELGDDRFAAVWLDEDGAVHVQGFRFMADGSVELAGTRSTAQLLDAGAPGAWVERLRVTAGGIGDKLAIGADRYEDYSSPGTVHWAVASFDGEDWQFEVLPAVQVPARNDLLDFDVYAGPLLDDGEPVIAWLWKTANGDLMCSIQSPRRMSQHSFGLTFAVGEGAVKFVHGKNRLNLFVQATSSSFQQSGMVHLRTLALDFAGELREFKGGSGERVTIADLVKYVRSLNGNLYGEALMNGLHKLVGHIGAIHSPSSP